MIEKLKNNFSYENLKELASKEDIMFGEQLLHRQIFIDISRLAKSDISKAMQEYTAYCSGSKAYIFKKY
jgi:hypothetical protein